MSARAPGILGMIFIVTLGILVNGASATMIEPEYKIRVAERPNNIVPGQPVDLEFIVGAAKSMEFRDVALTGKGWQVTAHRGLKSVGLAAGGETTLSFTVVPDGTWEPMILRFTVNGLAQEKTVDLSPWEVRATRFGGSFESADKTSFMDRGYGRIEDPPGTKPGPVPMDKLPPELFGDPDLLPEAGDKAIAATTSGRIGYYYKGDFRPVFGLTVTLNLYTGMTNVPLGSTTTNRDGSFEIDFGNAAPGFTLRLTASASNDAFAVMVDSYIWEDVYHWHSDIVVYDGSDIDWGDQVADDHFGAMEIVSATSRANTFLYSNAGLSGLPWVDIWWPGDCETSHYDREWEFNWTPDIYITNSRTWYNATHAHEYGHHFVVTQARSPEPDYCNPGGYCDEDPDAIFPDCTHCGWCSENENVAFTEGFPHWIADKVCRKWYDEPGRSPMGARYYKTALTCTNDGVDTGIVTDPWTTEGAFAALLHDMDDDSYDQDPAYPGFEDDLTVPIPYILRSVMLAEPISPRQLILNFHYLYPQYGEGLWQAMGNNGYTGLDVSGPMPGTISSPSHPVNVSRPSARVTLDISGYSDNWSGIAGFNIQINEDEPATPGSMINLQGNPGTTSLDAQPPGTYFISIRAIDRAGNSASTVQTYGPVIIHDPIPCDLMPEPWTANWDYPVMPKDSPVFDGQVVPADGNELIGDTYWNACLVNTGEVNSPNQRSTIMLDGSEIAYYDGIVHGFGDHLTVYNQGPLAIAGGRHTFELAGDHYQTVAETDETNNDWGMQWIWSPTIMYTGYNYFSDAAPMRTGGWDAIPSGPVKWYNCNGYRIFPSLGDKPSTWVAVWARGQNKSKDVDVRMHTMATSATAGFGSNIGASYRPPGYLDAVLVNTDVNSAMIYDIGIMTPDSQAEPSQYRAAASFGHALEPGVTFATTLAAQEGLDLYTFEADPAKQYTVTLELDEMDMSGPIKLSRYEPDFGTGDLLDYDGLITTAEEKEVDLVFTTTHTGPAIHAFAVWRDEIETYHYEQSYTIMVQESPPDLIPDQPAEWAGAIVPRRAADATDTWASEPALLSGDVALTWVNYAFGNYSQTASPGFTARVALDGSPIYLNGHSPLAAGEETTFRSGSSIIVKGGRHTLSLILDSTDLVSEADETNNTYAVQYAWEPTTMAFYSVVNRADPPSRTADWDILSRFGSVWFNCDARRTRTWYPAGTSDHWGAVAVMPGPATDVDLRLHHQSTGPTDGFKSPLVTSNWSRGQSELLVMNFRNSETREFDVGVVDGGYLTGEGYKITTVQSVGLDANPDGVVRNGFMSGNELVQLYEIEFMTYGLYHATLTVDEQDLDLGFSLYGPDLVYGGKSSVKDGTAAGWLETGGTPDTFDFYVLPENTGHHGLAVWKVGANDVSLSSSYTVTIELDALSPVIPESTPLVTRLLGAYPNPFNPRTTIGFELPRQESVSLRVFDVSGRLVDVILENEVYPAGRHEVAWQGQDDRGRALAAGVYFYRMETGDRTFNETGRMVLVK